jgi:hypothetical protein
VKRRRNMTAGQVRLLALHRRSRGAALDERAAEDDRMRLLAALLVLASLLVWAVFLQG